MKLYSLISLSFCNVAKNLMETPVLIFNKKFQDYHLSVGPQDIIDPANREIILIPFAEESIDTSKMVIHIDLLGHAVIKDFLRKYRSVVTGDSIQFTSKRRSRSDLWIKKVRADKDNVFRIIHDNKCLETSESLKGRKILSFQKCSDNEGQVWGASTERTVRNKITSGPEADDSFQIQNIADTIERLDTKAMQVVF
ncbi:hypothetical protein NUSPORA_00962 [Nucleospora cyclopteri]